MDHYGLGTHQWNMDVSQSTKSHTLLSQQGIEYTCLLVVHQHFVRDSVWLSNRADCRVHRVRGSHQKHPGGI